MRARDVRREAVAAARAQAVADGLARSSPRDPALRLGLSFAVAAACCAAVQATDAWAVEAAVVLTMGGLLLSLPAIAHEGAHGHLARSAWGNRVAGVVASAVALLPYSTFKYFHLEHHAHTATERDSEVYPETFTRRSFLVFPFVQLTFTLVLWQWTIQTLRGRPPRWIRDRRQAANVAVDAAAAVVLAGAGIAGVLLAGGDAWLVWPAPLPIAALLYSYTVLPEHFGARRRVTPTPDQIEYTATVLSNPVTRAVVWNSNFHAAHHFMPSVPACNLPKLDALISSLQPPEWRHRGYVSWYFETLAALDTSPWNAPLATSGGRG